MSRSAVRVRSSALYFSCKAYKKRTAHDHATGALAAVDHPKASSTALACYKWLQGTTGSVGKSSGMTKCPGFGGCGTVQRAPPECLEKREESCEVRCSNLRAPPRRGGRTSRRLSTMGVTLPNFATNRARKRSKVLRLVTLNFVENFSPVALELFLLWLLSHTKTAQHRRIRAWLIA
jgi:hypothetical protein